MLLAAACIVQAATVNYTATHVGGTTWRYDYVLTNDSLLVDIEEFTIYFAPNLYANLVAGPTAGWDILVIQPDSQIPDDGFYDGLVMGLSGIAPGGVAAGFSVTFNYLGAGTPGTQPFEVVDPQSFAPILSGSTVAAPPLQGLVDPNSVAFGGQSMFTPSVARSVTLSNTGGTALTISALNLTGPFAVKSHTCGTLPASLAAGANCSAQLTFTPPGEGPYDGALTVVASSGNAVVPLSGIGERSLVTHYFGAILGRSPDAAGKAWWQDQVVRMQGLGADINEVWYAMAMGFFNSAEYLGFGKTDGEFIDDLYRTFLNREPEASGRAFWLDQIAQGLTREVVLVAFMFSDEFRAFTASIFGDTAVRPELNAVMDFYRGLLSRLPDDAGFGFWVQQFRQAQCTGAAAVTAQAESISSQFATGPEYAGRNRTNSQYLGDLYNAILRRGGDAAGVNFWKGLLDGNALTREQVRQQFVQGPEFQGRVAQIIAAGCLP